MSPAFVSAQNILESDGLYISRFLDRPNLSSKLTSLPACLAGVGFMGYHTYIYVCMRALLYAQTRMSLLCICLYHAQHSMCMHAYTHIHTYLPTYLSAYINTYLQTYIPTHIHTCIHASSSGRSERVVA